MERGRSILTDTMPGTKAPAAGMPGMGAGNRPYASGIMQQKVSQISPTPSRVLRPQAQPKSAPMAQPPGEASQPAPPMPPGGPMATQNPTLSPDFYFQVMGTIMQALMNAAESPNILGGIY